MAEEISKVNDKNLLIEQRLETATSLLASMINVEKKFNNRLDEVNEQLKNSKALMASIQSLMADTKKLCDEIIVVHNHTVDIKSRVEDVGVTVSSKVNYFDKLEGQFNKHIKSVSSLLGTCENVNLSCNKTLSESRELIFRVEDKVSTLDKTYADIVEKEIALGKMLSSSSELLDELKKLKISNDELATQLRRKLEDATLRINKIENIEKNNLNVSEVYEKVYQEFKLKNQEILEEMMKYFTEAKSNTEKNAESFNKLKTSIEGLLQLLSDKGLTITEYMNMKKEDELEDQLGSRITQNSDSIDSLTKHIQSLEKSFLGRLILKLLRLKPL